MKKCLWVLTIITVIVCTVALVGCGVQNGSTNTQTNTSTSSSDDSVVKDTTSDSTDTTSDSSVEIITEDAASDSTFDSVTEATGDFIIETADGEYSESNGVYTISKSGTYTLSGSLNGQILVDAGEDDEIEIELSGVTITCSTDSPIKVISADKVEISAKKNTENVIKDTRSAKIADDESQGEGAICANCDLKLKGNGILVIEAGYNNGVHTKKDLTIKNLSLKVTAVNSALKGNYSVTVESGNIVAISTKGDGIKTEKTDLSSKGKQRGTVTITDGTLAVYAAGDGIQASYDFVMDGGSLSIYTGSYSSYTASDASTTSYKGIKVANELTVNGGTINVYSFDDGLHADYGTILENGNTGNGNININGGTITIGVYSPAKSTASGRMGPGGWSNQQSVSGSDAVHADNTLTITDGTIHVDSAYEGFEADHILISGGNSIIFGTDDGINACKSVDNNPTIVVSGGYLFVTVPTNGDTDGIDSNGTYTQTGGVVIACGPGSVSGGMGGGAWALDTDNGITLQGGTLIHFGGMENTPTTSGMTKTTCSSSTVSAGTHTVTVGEESYSVTLKYIAGGCVVYSDGGQATLR